MYQDNKYINLKYKHSRTIWRYMNFEKFISLLKNGLFFSTCYNMQKLDPFEGYYTDINLDKLKKEKINNEDYNKYAKGKAKDYRELFLKNTFINCWHIDTNENAAMWNIYTSGKSGLVIKSSITKLKKSFEHTNDDIYIGNIKYKDYEKNEIEMLYSKYIQKIIDNEKNRENDIYKKMPMQHFVTMFDSHYYPLIMSKRKEYKFENEIRVVSPFVPQNDKNCIKDYGKFIKVDLKKLINEIIISPNADDAFVDIVKNAIQTYNLKLDDKKIYKSKLYEKFD